jgi:hypothetical protein
MNNEVILGFWEESHINNLIIQDGCSLHINEQEKQNYIDSIYLNRSNDIPDSYDRLSGKASYIAYVSDEIYNTILTNKTIRLSQTELNNLTLLEEIFIEYI